MEKEITNPFSEGQEVVCVSEAFPCIIATGEDKTCVGKQAPAHPHLGEEIIIDEILGDFLRFDKYDTNESFMWWHHTRFRREKPFIIVTKEKSDKGGWWYNYEDRSGGETGFHDTIVYEIGDTLK